jgi:hypothetical protein
MNLGEEAADKPSPGKGTSPQKSKLLQDMVFLKLACRSAISGDNYDHKFRKTCGQTRAVIRANLQSLCLAMNEESQARQHSVCVSVP